MTHFALWNFQKFVNDVTRGLDFILSYINDLMIANLMEEQHEQYLEQFVTKLSQFSVVLNPDKCFSY